MTTNSTDSIRKYVRAANYLAAAQIYLQDNFLIDRPLEAADIKPRLLGHWGTCPGINFIYANLNVLVKKHSQDMLFVLGPGHGFPALQANLYIEGTLEKFYPKAKQNLQGLKYLASQFSWPYGFPSHSNPGTPGAILEGGELGYSLSTAYGAVLDNPELIAACVVGDGEAETGPLAAAWHLNKLVSPANNGVVLPILHLNGYKISGPTIFGRMSDSELHSLFYGYGYEPLIVHEEDPYRSMNNALEKAYRIIQNVRAHAKKDHGSQWHRLPMIILRSPKGWTGIKELNGEKIEGNCLSHQVVASNARRNPSELKAVEKWLKSYRFNELFNENNGFDREILSQLPPKNRRMGLNIHAFGGKSIYKPLRLPKVELYSDKFSQPGEVGSSSMRRAGAYLADIFRLNEKNKNIRLFSPDETYSNKLDEVFRYTSRAFTLPRRDFDRDIDPQGRVVEILSEHTLQGLLQGYVLTGRHGIFATYEAFAQIVSSMAEQYAKFIRVARNIKWRGDIPSLNYILTSSGWRQEHNGFSHQNPGFIDDLLLKQDNFINIYFPADANAMLVATQEVLSSKNGINAIVAGKTLEPRWLTLSQAREVQKKGICEWKFASDNHPNVIFAAAGDYLTKEMLAAISIVKKEVPQARIRFINISVMSSGGFGHASRHVKAQKVHELFGKDKPIIVNFHGYPQTVKQILFDYGFSNAQVSVHGYREQGSTTTPFDMHVRNQTDRYHVAIETFEKLYKNQVISQFTFLKLKNKYEKKLREHDDYIKQYGIDMEEIEQWHWQPVS